MVVLPRLAAAPGLDLACWQILTEVLQKVIFPI